MSPLPTFTENAKTNFALTMFGLYRSTLTNNVMRFHTIITVCTPPVVPSTYI